MNYKELIHSLSIPKKQIVMGNFSNLSEFCFYGVYIICDSEDDVVYIGSAYARKILKRLKQYLSPSDTGNTLAKNVTKSLLDSSKYHKSANEQIYKAIDLIKSFKIIAIPHENLEYKLIQQAKPTYNNIGKQED
ncbi:MAG: GIY-YIG nuclease family protein [Acutalibacteraceae bacterium]